MKKTSLIKCTFLVLGLGLFLGACRKDNKLGQSEPVSIEEDVPEIKYVKEEREVFKNSSKKKDFEKKYGFGKYSDAIKIEDALGNLVATEIGDFNLGINLKESDLAPGAVSAFVSYFDKDDKDLENGKDIEFGPIWVDDPKLISNMTFDKMSAESGDMLLVSLSVISENDQYSSYYIYNKNMSLIDYFSFTNSTENTSVEVTRGNKTYYPDGNGGSPGSLSEATEARVEVEKKILKEVKDTYSIKTEEVYQTIDKEKIPVANFPKDYGKVLKILTIESITNLESYPSDKGYFKIY